MSEASLLLFNAFLMQSVPQLINIRSRSIGLKLIEQTESTYSSFFVKL